MPLWRKKDFVFVWKIAHKLEKGGTNWDWAERKSFTSAQPPSQFNFSLVGIYEISPYSIKLRAPQMARICPTDRVLDPQFESDLGAKFWSGSYICEKCLKESAIFSGSGSKGPKRYGAEQLDFYLSISSIDQFYGKSSNLIKQICSSDQPIKLDMIPDPNF